MTNNKGWGLKSVSRRHRDPLSEIGFADFERLIADYYRGQGYAVDHCGTGALAARFDGGIDLKLRRGDEFILVQCKHWNAKQVTHNAVHELLGIMVNQGATGAIVVTSGEFTAAAKKAGGGRGQVKLVDGIEVRRMLADKLDSLVSSSSAAPAASVADRNVWEPVTVEGRRRQPGRRRRGTREPLDVVMVKIVVGVLLALALLFVVPAMFASALRSLATPKPAPPSATPAVQASSPAVIAPPAEVERASMPIQHYAPPPPPPPPTAQELAEAKAEQARQDAETQRILERIPEVTHYRYSPLDQNKDQPLQTGQ